MNCPMQKGIVQSSKNYIWNTADSLGRGASAVVYLGTKKNNGDVVAIKLFHEHNEHVAWVEFSCLRRLRHENLVILYDTEQERISKRLVLVIQYCEGGNLSQILVKPQYTHGLPEEEFLLLLQHLSQGLQYLWNHRIVPWNINPGNILRAITDGGRSTYKLTNFGKAGQENQGESEEFYAGLGTEEYLHPAIYGHVVLRLPTGRCHDPTLNLWSLGATLYHAATGQLPFQPYGGRLNRETMFHIISQKETGVISGVQRSESGPILFSRELPQTCSLSSGLKAEVTPLLAALLEKDNARCLSYEAFFMTADEIPGRDFLSDSDREVRNMVYWNRESANEGNDSLPVGVEESGNGNGGVWFDSPLNEEEIEQRNISRWSLLNIGDSLFFPEHLDLPEHVNLPEYVDLLQIHQLLRRVPQYGPVGHFYSLHPLLEQNENFIDIHNEVPNLLSRPQPSADVIYRRLLDEDDMLGHSDLQESLVGSYESGSGVNDEMHLSGQRFICQPDTDLSEQRVLFFSTPLYDVGFDALLYMSDSDGYSSRNVHHETSRKTVVTAEEMGEDDTDTEESRSSAASCEGVEVAASDSSQSGDDRSSTLHEEQICYLNFSDESGEKRSPNGVESTSGYDTTPWSAEGLGCNELQPGQLESFQTLPKRDENQPTQHSLLPSGPQQYLQPHSSPQLLDVPRCQLVRQLLASTQSERQMNEQVEHEEGNVSSSEEEVPEKK